MRKKISFYPVICKQNCVQNFAGSTLLAKLNNGAHCPAGFYGFLTSTLMLNQLPCKDLPLADSLVAVNTLLPEGNI